MCLSSSFCSFCTGAPSPSMARTSTDSRRFLANERTSSVNSGAHTSLMSWGHKWEDQVGRQDCMQSRQDYIIAVKEKKKRYKTRGRWPRRCGEARRVCGVTRQGGLSWQQVDNVCGSSRSYEAKRFISVVWRDCDTFPHQFCLCGTWADAS